MDKVAKLLKIIETPSWFHGVRMVEREDDDYIVLITNKKVDKQILSIVPEEIDGTEVLIVYRQTI